MAIATTTIPFLDYILDKKKSYLPSSPHPLFSLFPLSPPPPLPSPALITHSFKHPLSLSLSHNMTRGPPAGKTLSKPGDAARASKAVSADRSPSRSGTEFGASAGSEVAERTLSWGQGVYGQGPGCRYSHTTTSSAAGMVLIGGWEPKDKLIPNQLLIRRFSVQPSPCWDDLSDRDVICDIPVHPLTQHCACSNTVQDAIYIIGGWNPLTCKRKHAVWVLKDNVIERADQFTGQGPEGITFSAACCYKNTIFVFGGCTRELENTLWYVEADGGAWGMISAGSTTPCKRSSHCMAAVHNGFVVHGGRDEQGRALSDCFLYEADVGRWVPLTTPAGSVQPCARYGHAMTSYGSKIFLHGGVDQNDYALNDLYELDLQSDPLVWTQVTALATPAPRSYHSLSFAAGTLCLFGGKLGQNIPQKELADNLSTFSEEVAEEKPQLISDELQMLLLIEDEVCVGCSVSKKTYHHTGGRTRHRRPCNRKRRQRIRGLRHNPFLSPHTPSLSLSLPPPIYTVIDQ